jgi:hypothetical protein
MSFLITPRTSHFPLLHHHYPIIIITTANTTRHLPTTTSHLIVIFTTSRQSREGLLRFLRADKYDLQLCIDRIEKCLIWRRKEGMDDLEGLAKRVEGEVSTLPYNTSSIRLDFAKSERLWYRCADHGHHHGHGYMA